MVLLPEKEKRKKEGKKVHILKKFIPYYSPYKVVFFLDLICAAVISLIDLAYPQILRIMTKTIFAKPLNDVHHKHGKTDRKQRLQYDRRTSGKYCFCHNTKSYLFLTTIRTIPVR